MKTSIGKKAKKKNKWESDVATNVYYYYLQKKKKQNTDKQKPSICTVLATQTHEDTHRSHINRKRIF